MNLQEDSVVPEKGIEVTSPIPEGCIPIRAIEIVTYVNTDGHEEIGVRWQGQSNVVVELGMLEYAKLILRETHGKEI